MRTLGTLRPLALVAGLLATCVGQSQVTVATNNSNAGDYVGCDNTSPFPLRIMQNDNQPIEWYTDAVLRMRLLETNTTQTIGSYLNQTVSGNLGVGQFNTTNVTLPWSLLHLDDGGNQFSGYRPWQRPGMTITTGSDLGWIGLKDEGNDNHHFTLAWADNAASQGPDRLKFIFLANPTTLGTAGTVDGLEAARIKPNTDGLESFFGIGDWLTAGSNADPDERLDLLDRTIRLRNFMTTPPIGSGTDYERTTLENVLVVDPADGRVYWRTLSGWGSGCEWENNGFDDIVTAHLPSAPTGCPDATNMVGIGVIDPQAKLDVVKTYDNGFGTEIGVRSQMSFVSATKVAIDAINVYEASENFGVRSAVDGAERNWGMVSLTGTGAQGGSVVSGFFHADGEYITQDPIGVWGVSVNDMSGGPGWAGWFDGYGYLSLGPWVTSDANLKQNIEPLDDCLDVVQQLAPKSYEFAAQDHPEMNLPTGYQAGLLAQDLQQVLPHLVREAHRPEMTDSAGNVISAAADLLTVNYEGIIPYLIGAIHELKATNDAQQAQISTLQQVLATCCAAHGSTDGRGMSAGAGAGAGEALRTDLFIVPNPVADHTQLRYTLATPGRTRLEVSDASGKRLEVLEEAVREAGTYTYAWDTTDLAPGTYHCTLYLNDGFVVRKAVKVAQ